MTNKKHRGKRKKEEKAKDSERIKEVKVKEHPRELFGFFRSSVRAFPADSL
jgi:hypothetical protein